MESGRLVKVLRHYFLTGLFALLPLAVTVYVGYEIVLFFNGIGDLFGRRIPGLGLVVTLAFITLFGAFVNNFLGQQSVKILDRVFSRVPVLRNIYEVVKQMVDTLFVTKGEGRVFKRVVFVPYPHAGARALGFVVNESLAEGRTGVFVPFSPPTGGQLFFFESSSVEASNLTVEEAMKLYLSGGTLTPHHDDDPLTPLVKGESE